MEIHYEKATLFKRFMAYVIDLFLLIFLTISIFYPSTFIYKTFSIYKENKEKIDNTYRVSMLYKEIDNKFIDLITFIEEKELNNEESYNLIKDSLDYFYINLKAFSHEETYKNEYLKKLKESNYFELINENYVLKKEYTYKEGYEFLKEIYKDSIKYLSNNKYYIEGSTRLLLIELSTILISYFISYLVLYLLIPLIIKNGNKSIGRLIFHINIVNYNGLNLSATKFIGYSLFNFLFIYFLSIFAFFIPSLVSLLMIIFSKDNRSFSEYIFNIYLLDSKSKNIINN